MGTETETVLLPGVKVVLDRDGASDALAGADGPKLLERCSSDDGGLVGSRGLVDVVGTAVAGDLTLLLSG